MSNLKFVTIQYTSKPSIIKLVDQELKKDVNQNSDGIEKYKLVNSDIQVYCFEGTVKGGKNADNNSEYLAVQMSLPAVFFDPTSKEKFKYSGLFIVDPISLILSPSSGDHGIYNCPIPIRIGGNDEYTRKDETTQDECFQFLNQYYYPLLLPNWGIYFYITESPLPHLNINDSDPDLVGNDSFTYKAAYKDSNGQSIPLHVLSGDEQVMYDTGLGIFYSRKVGVLNQRTKTRVKF